MEGDTIVIIFLGQHFLVYKSDKSLKSTMPSDKIVEGVLFSMSHGFAYTTHIKLKGMYTRLCILTDCIYNGFDQFNYNLEMCFTDQG